MYIGSMCKRVMNLYAGNAYVLLFFIYGLAFFVMGVVALLQRTSSRSSFPLQQSILYLGLFGVIHGITEWIIMARISGLVPEWRRQLFALGTFTNGLSFVFLWLFGAKQLVHLKRPVQVWLNRLPWIIFGAWTIAFGAALLVYGTSQLHWLFLEDIFSRYFIGFPGAMLAVYALLVNARDLQLLQLGRASLKMKSLAVFFGAYGFFAGLVVDDKGFFPNSVINKTQFLQLTGFPVEIGRAASAVTITLLFVNLIRIFEWENERKMKRLMKQQALTQQRTEMGRELHDVIVQHMFATGLKLEELMDRQDCRDHREELEEIRAGLNWSMDQIRTFIGQEAGPIIQMEDLKSSLVELAGRFEQICGMPVELTDQVPEFTYGALSKEAATHVYYILQEALWNAFKHSGATKLTILIRSSMSTLIATVQDNGEGFNPDEVPDGHHFGLKTMKKRASEIGGTFTLKSNERGTLVTISVPWEESEDEK